MNLKIILKDSKYCDGCLCEIYTGQNGNNHLCNKKYDVGWEYIMVNAKLIRPQKCIDENGE